MINNKSLLVIFRDNGGISVMDISHSVHVPVASHHHHLVSDQTATITMRQHKWMNMSRLAHPRSWQRQTHSTLRHQRNKSQAEQLRWSKRSLMFVTRSDLKKN